jgi:hypothetical protein
MGRIDTQWSTRVFGEVAGGDDITSVWNLQTRKTLIAEFEEDCFPEVSAPHVAEVTIEKTTLAESIKAHKALHGYDVSFETRLPQDLVRGIRVGGASDANEHQQRRRDCIVALCHAI